MRGGRRRRAVAHRITGDREGRPLRGEHRPGAFTAAALVLATGGPSIPKMGATGFAHDIARRFGLELTETRPALVPLTLEVPELSGVSLEVVARWPDGFREAMLFTHRGLSGPAILQISSYWRAGRGDLDRPAARHRCGAVPQGAQAVRGPRPSCARCWPNVLPQRLAQSLAAIR